MVKTPAVFTTSGLSILPVEVNIGEAVTISVVVSNTGDLSGDYKVTLKVDNIIVDTKEIIVDGGGSQKVTFTTTKNVAGTYMVNVDGLAGEFTVKGPDAPAYSPAPSPEPPPPVTPKPAKWWLIGSILAAYIILFIVVWRIVRRRRV